MVHKTKVVVKWLGGGTFEASDGEGHSTLIQLHSERDAKALSPSQLLLAAIGSCSAVDVVSILQKRRKELRELVVEVEGDRVEGFPARYSDVAVKYVASGEGISKEELEKSVELSMEKYCSVSITVKTGARVSTLCEVKGQSP